MCHVSSWSELQWNSPHVSCVELANREKKQNSWAQFMQCKCCEGCQRNTTELIKHLQKHHWKDYAKSFTSDECQEGKCTTTTNGIFPLARLAMQSWTEPICFSITEPRRQWTCPGGGPSWAWAWVMSRDCSQLIVKLSLPLKSILISACAGKLRYRYL